MFGTNVRYVYICQWTWNDFQIQTLYSTNDMYPQTESKRVHFKHSEKFSKIIFKEIGLRKIIVSVVVCDCFKAFCRIYTFYLHSLYKITNIAHNLLI